MARPSPLVVRWRQYKAKSRKTSYFARGLQKKLTGFDKFRMREEDAMQYSHRVGEGVRLADLTKETLTSVLESKFDKFNHFVLKETGIGFAWLFFSGQDYFILEKRDIILRRSLVMSDKDRLIRKWECNALTWVKQAVIPSSQEG